MAEPSSHTSPHLHSSPGRDRLRKLVSMYRLAAISTTTVTHSTSRIVQRNMGRGFLMSVGFGNQRPGAVHSTFVPFRHDLMKDRLTPLWGVVWRNDVSKSCFVI